MYVWMRVDRTYITTISILIPIISVIVSIIVISGCSVAVAILIVVIIDTATTLTHNVGFDWGQDLWFGWNWFGCCEWCEENLEVQIF